MLLTERLQLRPASLEILRAELDGPAALGAALDVAMPTAWPPELFDEPAIRHTIDWLAAHPGDGDWGLYHLILRDHDGGEVLVGIGGFKGGPGEERQVEVGYSLAVEHQGHGYATEAVHGWIAFAFESGRVDAVVAHTLSTLTPSIRVLERTGFRLTGRGTDPDVPPGSEVLRFERHRVPPAGHEASP